MTIEQAKSELMQIYGALSPSKQQAIDTLVKIEPCEDAISRQATLEPYKVLNDTDTLCVALIRANIMQQPPVNPQDPKWISVSERLPEDGTWNLFTDGKNVSVERYKSDAIDHFFPEGRWFSFENVIAWMPFPESYMESEK